jgi:hypothetical protein
MKSAVGCFAIAVALCTDHSGLSIRPRTYDLAALMLGEARAIQGKRAVFCFQCPADRSEKVEEGNRLFLYCEIKPNCLVIVSLADDRELPLQAKVEARLVVEKGYQRDYIVYRLEEPAWPEQTNCERGH